MKSKISLLYLHSGSVDTYEQVLIEPEDISSVEDHTKLSISGEPFCVVHLKCGRSYNINMTFKEFLKCLYDCGLSTSSRSLKKS